MGRPSLGFFENLVINFFSIFPVVKVYINYFMLGKISYLENSDSWDMAQDVLGQWDCRIFKSNIFLE